MNLDPLRRDLPEEERAILGFDPIDPEAEKKAERIRAERLEARKLGLTNLLNQPWFREWLMEFLTGWQTFDGINMVTPTGYPDPMATQFFLGKKQAGWELWEVFDELDPEKAALMRREARRPKDEA